MPVDGFRKAAVDPEAVCPDCRADVGGILGAWDWGVVRKLKKHQHERVKFHVVPEEADELAELEPDLKATAEELAKHAEVRDSAEVRECSGLALQPILVTILNLPRRDGKTFNSACWALSTICLQRNRNILFVAAAGKQTRRIFREAFEKVIQQDAKLTEVCVITGERIDVPSTGSCLQTCDTSFRSITGSGFSHILVDECRDVHPRVLAAAVFSTGDQNGAECPYGHEMHADVDPEEIGNRKCSHCGERLVPWYPRVILTSSSGLKTDDEMAWFEELADALEEMGHPMAHCYRSTKSSNPSVSLKVKQGYGEIFGLAPSLRVYVDVELTNRARRIGEDFVSESDIRAIVSSKLKNVNGDPRPAFGFLDTSWSSDITTLAIGVDWYHGQPGYSSWAHLQVVHLLKWKPKKLPGGHIDPSEVQAALDRLIPMFPNLKALLVDDRGMKWAKDLVVWNNQNRPGWGKKVKAFHGRGARGLRDRGERIPGVYGGDEDRSIAWQMLEYRIACTAKPKATDKALQGLQTILVPDDPDFRAELLAVQRKIQPDGSYVIMDRSRKKRHADVAEAIAGLCMLAYYDAITPTASLTRVDSKAASRLATLKPMSSRLRPEGF